MLVRNNSPIQITVMFQAQSRIAIAQNRTCCNISAIFARAIQWLKDLYHKFCGASKPITARPVLVPLPPQVRALPHDQPQANNPPPREPAEQPQENNVPPREPAERPQANNAPPRELAEPRQENVVPPRELAEPVQENNAPIEEPPQPPQVIVLPPDQRDEIDMMDHDAVVESINGIQEWVIGESGIIDLGNEARMAEFLRRQGLREVRLAALEARAARLRAVDIPAEDILEIERMDLNRINEEIAELESNLSIFWRGILDAEDEHSRSQSQTNLDLIYWILHFLHARARFFNHGNAPVLPNPRPLSREERDDIAVMDRDEVNEILGNFERDLELARNNIQRINAAQNAEQNGEAYRRNRAVLAISRRRLHVAEDRRQALQARLQQLRDYALPADDRQRLAELPLPDFEIRRLLSAVVTLRVQLSSRALGREARREMQSRLDRSYVELDILRERQRVFHLAQAAAAGPAEEPAPLRPREQFYIQVLDRKAVKAKLDNFEADLEDSRARIRQINAMPPEGRNAVLLATHKRNLQTAEARKQALEARLQRLTGWIVAPVIQARLEALNLQGVNAEIRWLERETENRTFRLMVAEDAEREAIQDKLDQGYAELHILRSRLGY